MGALYERERTFRHPPEPKTPRQWHRRVWALTWPVFLANLTIPMVGLVDTAVMGRMPEPAYVGAVTVGAAIMTAIYWVFGFLRMGTTGLAAQAYGRGAVAEVAATAVRGGTMALALGATLLLLQQPLHDLALHVFPASDAVERLASGYLLIRIWGTPAMLLHLVTLGVLFGLQRMGAALLISLLLNASNAALDLLLVLGLGWGVTGVAVGTLVSEWFAALAGIFVVHRALRAAGWTARLPERLLERARLAEVFGISGNLLIRSFLLQFPFLAFTALSASLGDVILAANAVLMQFFYLMAFGLDSVAHTAETLTGFAYGARRPGMLRRAMTYCFLWGASAAGAVTLGYFVLGGALIDLLSAIDTVRVAAREYLPWAAVGPALAVWAFLLDGVFIGTTRTRELRNAMVCSVLVWALALWLGFSVYRETLGNHGLWLAMSVFLAVRGLFLGALYPRVERLALSSGPRTRGGAGSS